MLYVFTITIFKNLEPLISSYVLKFSSFHCIGKLILPVSRAVFCIQCIVC